MAAHHGGGLLPGPLLQSIIPSHDHGGVPDLFVPYKGQAETHCRSGQPAELRRVAGRHLHELAGFGCSVLVIIRY